MMNHKLTATMISFALLAMTAIALTPAASAHAQCGTAYAQVNCDMGPGKGICTAWVNAFNVNCVITLDTLVNCENPTICRLLP